MAKVEIRIVREVEVGAGARPIHVQVVADQRGGPWVGLSQEFASSFGPWSVPPAVRFPLRLLPDLLEVLSELNDVDDVALSDLLRTGADTLGAFPGPRVGEGQPA